MNILEKAIDEGLVGGTDYKVYILNKEYLGQIMKLQQDVILALNDQNTLQPLTEEEFAYILSGNGIMIGAFVHEVLIAFRALLFPQIDKEHLGYDIGLAEESDLKRILYQEISNVHPNYRGFGLQKRLSKVIMQQVDYTKFDYVCATVAPYNIASLKDKFSQGMYIKALKKKYGGKLRYVFMKSLHNENQYEEASYNIMMNKIEEQQELLKKGYVGVSIKKVDNNWIVEYREIRV